MAVIIMICLLKSSSRDPQWAGVDSKGFEEYSLRI